MVSDRVIEEVQDQLSRGMGLVEVKQQLLSKGWSDFEIEEAMSKAEEREKEKLVQGEEEEEEDKKKGFFRRLVDMFR